MSALCEWLGATVAVAFLTLTLQAEDPRLNNLARTMKDGSVVDKIDAAKELAQMGPDAKAVAGKNLAAACFDPVPKVAQTALAALEKVWPELYEPGVTLLKDNEDMMGVSNKRANACEAIAKLPDGDAGVPFLMHHLRTHLEKDNDFYRLNTALTPNVEALKQLAADNPAFHKILLTGASNFNVKHRNRALAVEALGTLGEANPKLRKQFIPTLRTACNAQSPDPKMISHPKNDVRPVRVAAIEALAKFGKDAQPELPMLKKLKLDPEDSVRKAAKSAVDVLEAVK
ncbi:MAG TPA: hypothetical protein VGZ47_06875 [Gemmataceae bacterium]|jgi:HEAT repeat protein|nr:hypothetical protein [Gemmataceae bacterium]